MRTDLFVIVTSRSDLWCCIWLGEDISCSCEEQGSAIGGCYCSCEANCFVFCEFSIRLIDNKGKLYWFRVFECWLLLYFVDIVLKIVLWFLMSFLISSSFVQSFFFRRDIFSFKDFSCWFGKLRLTSLSKYPEKESLFLFKRVDP